jgi:hypothetical protein
MGKPIADIAGRVIEDTAIHGDIEVERGDMRLKLLRSPGNQRYRAGAFCHEAVHEQLPIKVALGESFSDDQQVPIAPDFMVLPSPTASAG